VDAARIARLYGIVLGSGLLLEGGVLLILDVLRIMPGDSRHNALHLVWGVAILRFLTISRAPQQALLTMLTFGVFYSALAVTGLLIDRPFGLVLGPGENAFHFIVGPLALGLGLWAAVQLSSSSERSAASVASAATGSASGERAAPR
jgi:Domain of unknown function (DUF4383)